MSIQKITYTRDWTNPSDFPTIETSEAVVRSDMQSLYDQIRDGVNDIIDQIDGPDGATNTGVNPITGVSGANVQEVVEDLKNQVDSKASTSDVEDALDYKEDITTANQLVKTIEYTSSDGKFKITTQGGTVTYIDTNIEKVPGTMALVEDPVGSGTYYLVIYDTSTPPVELSRCPVSTLFNAISVEDTSTIDLTLTPDSTGKKTLKATVKAGSITTTELESSILTTIAGYAQIASEKATEAAASATTAAGYVTAAGSSATAAAGSASDATLAATESERQAGIAAVKASEANVSAGNASVAASNAATQANNAQQKSTLAGQWAVGPTKEASQEYGTPTDTNNAWYYMTLAAEIASAEGTMQRVDYDITKEVQNAGGIPAYVEENYVAKEEGKGLSENDYTDEDKALVESAVQPAALDDYRTADDQDIIDAAKMAKNTYDSTNAVADEGGIAAYVENAIGAKEVEMNAVSYNAQSKTDAEKAQARANIGTDIFNAFIARTTVFNGNVITETSGNLVKETVFNGNVITETIKRSGSVIATRTTTFNSGSITEVVA